MYSRKPSHSCVPDTYHSNLPTIAIPGWANVVEPIKGGTVNGSAVNGTIISGFAYPSIYNNRTLDVPSTSLYVRTGDGQTFYVSEMGVGTLAAQVTSIIWDEASTIVTIFVFVANCSAEVKHQGDQISRGQCWFHHSESHTTQLDKYSCRRVSCQVFASLLKSF